MLSGAGPAGRLDRFTSIPLVRRKMEFRAGARFKSTVCSTEILIVKSPKDSASLKCGGVEMIPITQEPPPDVFRADDARGGTLLGKRYVSDDGEFEVLCNKSGECSLEFGDT